MNIDKIGLYVSTAQFIVIIGMIFLSVCLDWFDDIIQFVIYIILLSFIFELTILFLQTK